tara:strand:- start:1039 stop:1506 length:468 start_codon:yes stop_codon:yes gene_type:complete
MKYATLGPRKAVNRISDTEPQTLPGLSATVVEFTDEQAHTVLAGLSATPSTRYFYLSGDLITFKEKMALERPTPVLTQEQTIRRGEAYVQSKGFSAARLVTLMDKLLQVKEANALASNPKLVAVYQWLQEVKAKAIATQIDFSEPPYTFEEVITE